MVLKPENGGPGENAAVFRIGDRLGSHPENASQQPVALVTGGSRDIGESITRELIRHNVAVIATCRKERKSVDYLNIKESITSVGGVLHPGDIKTPEVRQELTDHVDRLGGSLDYLILNAADATRELNVEANLALMRSFLPRMKEGGAVVVVQSHPGHFYNVMDKNLLFKEYEGVAVSKYEEEAVARREMQENPDAQGKKLFVVVAPSIPDTTNANFFKRVAADAKDNFPALARGLGLPEYASSDDVGSKIWELIERRDELPQIYTEFFSDTVDAWPILKRVYKEDDAAVYVDTVDDEKISRAFVTDSRINEANISLVDQVEGDFDLASSITTIKDEHLKGHFGVFPGHKGIRVVEETMQRVFERGNESDTLRLSDVAEIKFNAMLVPGNKIKTVVEKTGLDRIGAIYNATITSGDDVCYEMKGLRFVREEKGKEDTLRANQFAEIAGQAVMVAVDNFRGDDGQPQQLPIYKSIENLSVLRLPKKGEALRVVPVLFDVGREKSIAAGVDIFAGDELIAWVNKLEGIVVQESTVAGLKRRAEKRNSGV